MRRKQKKILLLVLGSLVLAIALLFYGPFPAFRELWINTAMNTSRHKFLAQWLYTDKYISKVLQTNLVSTDQRTDDAPLSSNGSRATQFAEIEGKYYKGYLIKIDDPASVSLAGALDEKGALLETLVGQSGAAGGINASGYIADDLRGTPSGYCVRDGAVVRQAVDSHPDQKHIIGGMDENNRLRVGSFASAELPSLQWRWAVEFGPVLVVNGNKTEITPKAGGLAPRTAIGQTKSGAILLLVVDGRRHSSLGATYLDLQVILHANGAVNAMVLDGGSSSSMVYEGELMNSPSNGVSDRHLPNAIVYG